MSPGNGPEDGGILPRLVRGGAGGKRQCVPVRAIGRTDGSERGHFCRPATLARPIAPLFGPASPPGISNFFSAQLSAPLDFSDWKQELWHAF